MRGQTMPRQAMGRGATLGGGRPPGRAGGLVLQPGSLTTLRYDIGPGVLDGRQREPTGVGQFASTIVQVSLA
jgi:hypothetical protein